METVRELDAVMVKGGRGGSEGRRVEEKVVAVEEEKSGGRGYLQKPK